jgi:DNA-binding NarL/FixJ family response regulator
MRLVVAVHGREVKTALFLALTGIEMITIVATATSTAELVSYCRAFRPDLAIVESGLPGKPLAETLGQLDEFMIGGTVFVIDGASELVQAANAEVFTDVDDLVAALPVSARTEEER